MKTLLIASFLGLVLGTNSASAQTSKVGDALTSKTTAQEFKAELKQGFHFNEQAPNLVTVDSKNIKPKKLAKREATFSLPKADYRSAHASLYVCDDEKTFCEPMSVNIKGDTASPNADVTKPKSKKIVINHHGFIADNLEAARDKAQKEKKLIIVDFAARWCPGCVRLENEVFETAAFKKAAKDFVKVRLDYDRFENLSLGKQKYGIKFIPTLLVLNSELDEVSRVVDFQPMSVVGPFLKDAQTNPQSFAQLKEKIRGGDKAASLILGQRLYKAMRFEEAVANLKNVDPKPIELLDAQVQMAREAFEKDDKLKANFQKVAREAIKQEPSSTRSIGWRTALAKSLAENEKERGQIVSDGVKLADDLIATEGKIAEAIKGDAIGEFTGLERLLVAYQRADLIESTTSSEDEKQQAMLKVVQVAKEAKIPVTRTGPAMRYLIFLVGAKQWPEAETHGRALLKRDPKNPELQRRMIRVLNEQKKFDEAIKLGREALPESFGKNEVWVAQQLAKAYAGGGKKQEAKALAQTYLDRKDIDWNAMKSEQKDLTEVVQTN